MVFSDGVATESFFPGPEALSAFEQDARSELFDLFPELRRVIDAGSANAVYGERARDLVGWRSAARAFAAVRAAA